MYEKCLLTTANTATFKITDAKLDVPIVTLSVEDNSKLSKLLSEGFKRPIYWNEYKVTPNKVVEFAAANDEKHVRELLDSNSQGFNRLFVLAYNNAAGNNQVSVDSYKKYFLPRVKIDNYNIEIDGRNFYDQPINDSIKQYDEISVSKCSVSKYNVNVNQLILSRSFSLLLPLSLSSLFSLLLLFLLLLLLLLMVHING